VLTADGEGLGTVADGDGVLEDETDGGADGVADEADDGLGSVVISPEVGLGELGVGLGVGAGAARDPLTVSLKVVPPLSPSSDRPEASSTVVTAAAVSANTMTAPTRTVLAWSGGRRGVVRAPRGPRSTEETRSPVCLSELVYSAPATDATRLTTAAPLMVPTTPSLEPSAAAVAAASEPPTVWARESSSRGWRDSVLSERDSLSVCWDVRGRFSVRVLIHCFQSRACVVQRRDERYRREATDPERK
jgi:hypothetical protein